MNTAAMGSARTPSSLSPTSPSPAIPTAAKASPDGRRTRWDQHRQSRRRELIRAARNAVHDLGPQSSMDEIAAHAGTSKSVFYRYFGDKNGLQMAVGQSAIEFMEQELIEAAETSDDALDGLYSMVSVYLSLAESSPHVYAFSTRLPPEAVDTGGQPAAMADFFERIAVVMDGHFRTHLRQLGHRPSEGSATWYWPRAAIGMIRSAGEAWLAADGGPDRPEADRLARKITAWLTTGLAGMYSPSVPPFSTPTGVVMTTTSAVPPTVPAHATADATADATAHATADATAEEAFVSRAVSSAVSPAEPGGLDLDRVQELLLGRWARERRQSREFVKDPGLHRVDGLSMAEHRERVMGQLRILAEAGVIHRAFPRCVGGEEDHGGNVAGFAELITADPSLQIKAGVQWGLFGAAIMHLGTREHHEKWLPQVISLELPGAFAMTEIGHGSDVASLGTTATYVPEDDEFEIHTPVKAAWKDYLGNAALHGRAAVVFAQLITRGVNHGVHAFFVPLRDASGAFLPGVGGEDDGLKGGLNGIDNGRLHFSHVRIPRTNLLDKYGSVAQDGTYTSPIDSPGRRFFTMIGTLVQGRVSLSLSAAAASALALTGAITYGNQRRQFNATSDTHEEVLMDYQLHQRRLIDRLARTYADAFAANELTEKFDAVFRGEADTDADRQELETLAAAIKPLATWNALDTLQEAREACGGAGFMAKNRFALLRADLDIFVTFEGDNNVLLQLVGKRLLADYSKELSGFSVGALSRFVAAQATEAVVHRSGLRRVVQSVQDAGSERKSASWFKETAVQRALLEDRVRTKTAAVAQALLPVAKKSRAEQAATFNRHQSELIDAARNHAELLEWEAFTRAVESVEDDHTRQVLTWLRDLFALRVIEDDLGWFLENARISPQRARTLRQYINRLAYRLRPHAQDLVDAWGYEPEHVRMDVAAGDEARRQNEAAAYHRALRASADAPVDEKSLRRTQARH